MLHALMQILEESCMLLTTNSSRHCICRVNLHFGGGVLQQESWSLCYVAEKSSVGDTHASAPGKRANWQYQLRTLLSVKLTRQEEEEEEVSQL